jgi:hypothetical protein
MTQNAHVYRNYEAFVKQFTILLTQNWSAYYCCVKYLGNIQNDSHMGTESKAKFQGHFHSSMNFSTLFYMSLQSASCTKSA